MRRFAKVLGVAAATVLVPAALSAQAFNGGLIGSCAGTGTCGTSGANGNVGLSGLSGSTAYGYIVTNGGVSATGNNIGYGLGGETNGSKWTFNFMTANPNTVLSFRFNYITRDGAGYSDYAYATLLGGADDVTLFNARTIVAGNTVPGFDLPAIEATIVPASTPIIAGAPVWSLLGATENAFTPLAPNCYAAGCGYTGWISMTYTIAQAGAYSLDLGVVNWSDTEYQSGMAFDFALDNGVPVDPNIVPEPSTYALMALGLLGVGGMARRRRSQI